MSRKRKEMRVQLQYPMHFTRIILFNPDGSAYEEVFYYPHFTNEKTKNSQTSLLSQMLRSWGLSPGNLTQSTYKDFWPAMQ